MGFALMLISAGKKSDKDKPSPNQKKVYTTLDRTIVPDMAMTWPVVKINDPGNFEKYGYGKWHYGPGLPCQKRLDLMPSGYDYSSVTNAGKLLRFFTISDIHLTDKESPCQLIYFAQFAPGGLGISLYSPLMLYTTHVLEATINTVNGLHKQDAIDFGIALGDLGNSMQHNELRWFIDIMDGKTIKPYSGGHKSGTNNQYQDEFKASGLDASIPWYATLGNHDHFFLGSLPMNPKIQNALTGNTIMQVGNVFSDTDPLDKSTYSAGTLDGSTQYGNIIGAGKVSTMGAIPTITPDPDRHAILSIDDWTKEFNNSTSLPGHGFIQSNSSNVFGACYSFIPKSDMPIKVIVLDNTMDANGGKYEEGFYGHGDLNNGRYDWLMSQLKAGQEANQLMIIAAHVPIGVSSKESGMDWKPAPGYTNEKDLINQLRAFPNLILWVSGHRHLNNVTAFPSIDPAHPENSFWEVETKSLREFPEQFRTLDIVRNSDNTISIITTNVDADMPAGSQAAIGRSYAIASFQVYGIQGEPLPTGSVSYNAELVKKLSPAMQNIISNYGKPIK